MHDILSFSLLFRVLSYKLVLKDCSLFHPRLSFRRGSMTGSIHCSSVTQTLFVILLIYSISYPECSRPNMSICFVTCMFVMYTHLNSLRFSAAYSSTYSGFIHDITINFIVRGELINFFRLIFSIDMHWFLAGPRPWICTINRSSHRSFQRDWSVDKCPFCPYWNKECAKREILKFFSIKNSRYHKEEGQE